MSNDVGPWRCDNCAEMISDPKGGYVIWDSSGGTETNFRIVHHVDCDTGSMYSKALDELLGVDGLSWLLYKVSVGPIKIELGQKSSDAIDADGYVDLIRRVQIPNYEQARPFLKSRDVVDEYQDSTEFSPYRQASLQRIVDAKRA